MTLRVSLLGPLLYFYVTFSFAEISFRIPLKMAMVPRVHDSNDNSLTIPLKNVQDLQFIYWIEIFIGTPMQLLNVQIDTGSSFSWVATTDYQAARTPGFHKFNVHKSRTSHILGGYFKTQYTLGSVKGRLSEDTVQVGNVAIKRQRFIEAMNVDDIFLNFGLDGVLGLGYQKQIVHVFDGSIAVDHQYLYLPFFINLKDEFLVGISVFTICLNRNTSDHNNAGEIIFGGIDRLKFTHSPIYVPISKQGSWQFTMGSIYMNNKIIAPLHTQALVNTGTTFISGPPAEVALIYENLGVEGITEKQNNINCQLVNQLPTIILLIQGKSFPVKGEDYVIQTGNNVCQIGFVSVQVPFPRGPLWILGTLFVRKYCTIFDLHNSRIGFAENAN